MAVVTDGVQGHGLKGKTGRRSLRRAGSKSQPTDYSDAALGRKMRRHASPTLSIRAFALVNPLDQRPEREPNPPFLLARHRP